MAPEEQFARQNLLVEETEYLGASHGSRNRGGRSYQHYRPSTGDPQRNYRPSVLKFGPTVLLFLVTLGLIAGVEVAIRKLPSDSSSRQDESTTKLERLLKGRDISNSSTSSQINTGTVNPGLYLQTGSSSASDSTTATVNPDLYLPTTSTSSPTQSSTQSSKQSSKQSSAPSIAYSTDPNAYMPTKSSSTVSVTTATTNPEAYLPTKTPSTSTASSATKPQAYLPTETPATSTSNSEAYLPTVSLSTSANPVTSADAYLPTDSTSLSSLPSGTLTEAYLPTTSTSNTLTNSIIPTTASTESSGGSVDPTSSSSSSSTTPNGSLATGSFAANINTSNKHAFTPMDYFVGNYLGTLIAVFYRSWWKSYENSIKLVAPFMELAQPGGAESEILSLYYLGPSLDTLRSIFSKHWVVLWTSLTTFVVVGLMAPLASELLSVDVKYQCPSSQRISSGVCPPRLAVNTQVGRALEGLLTLSAIMLITIWHLGRRSTGLTSDPSKISTMASLLHHPDVVQDFLSTDPDASSEQLKHQLRGNRYALEYYMTPTGDSRYGLVKLGAMSEKDESSRYLPLQQEQNLSTGRSSGSIWTIVLDCGFIILLLGVLGVILAYYKDGSSDGFNRWMNSQSFGPRFFMTLIGIAIDFGWKNLQSEVVVLASWRSLAKSPPKSASETVNISNSFPHPLLTIPYWLWRRHNFFLVWVSFVSLLDEVLIIAISAIPYSANQYYLAFLSSAYMSMGILGLMVLSVGMILIWRRGNPKLPRPPTSAAAVWSYLCTLNDKSKLGSEDGSLFQYEGDLTYESRYYYMAELAGRDGVVRWNVDDTSPDHVPSSSYDPRFS